MHALHWEPAEATLPPCLLVHGLASNARLWDGVARRLAALGHPVVAIDQRGHGHSSKPDGPFDMASVADDLRLLVTELGWEQPLIAGQSMNANTPATAYNASAAPSPPSENNARPSAA